MKQGEGFNQGNPKIMRIKVQTSFSTSPPSPSPRAAAGEGGLLSSEWVTTAAHCRFPRHRQRRWRGTGVEVTTTRGTTRRQHAQYTEEEMEERVREAVERTERSFGGTFKRLKSENEELRTAVEAAASEIEQRWRRR